MKDYTKSEMRSISEAYMMVLEAQGRANFFKNLTPEQAEYLAKLSPSYKSPQIWGATSNWICSIANNMVKYRSMSFEKICEIVREYAQDIADFEKFAKKIRKDIGTVKSFEELRKIIEEARRSGITQTELSRVAKKDGRARQCYSLMKNGGDDFTITYEDDDWLIGYPHNFAYNSKFSSIGKWCHTGSFGDGEHYWSQYASQPVFYILNKQNGTVLCASYNGNAQGEIRDQSDNWPEGGKNWANFFTSLGLKTPMVDNIGQIMDSYIPPEDEIEPPDIYVYDRIDYALVDRYLFGNTDNYLELEDDDSGRGGGDFIFRMPLENLSPDYSGDDSLYTRYARDVDTATTYTFDEFAELVKIINSGDNGKDILLYIIKNVKCFSELWNGARNMPSITYIDGMLYDEHTMSERMSLDELYRLYSGEDVRFGYDSRRKQDDIRKHLKMLIDNFKKQFLLTTNLAIPDNFGYISFIGGHSHAYIDITIDADEAEGLANRVANGEFGDNDDIDILSLNLSGKNEFSVKRIDEEHGAVYHYVYNCIMYLKWICKTPKDLDGQIRFEMRTNYEGEPVVDYYEGNDRIRDFPQTM